MELELFRDLFTPNSAGGILLVDRVFECFTLEDTDRQLETGGVKIPGQTAIPRGRYRIELYDSPKHGPNTLQLVGVPYYAHVQMHPGNKPEDTEGCILLGRGRDPGHPDWVSQSRLAFETLHAKVMAAFAATEEVWITIS